VCKGPIEVAGRCDVVDTGEVSHHGVIDVCDDVSRVAEGFFARRAFGQEAQLKLI